MGRTALFAQHQPGGVFTVQDVAAHPGNIFFVSSTAAGASDGAGYGRNPDSPFATLAYALSSDVCTAGQQDVIYVLPGHVEARTTAITADIEGVSIIGLGEGDTRPQLTGGANGIDVVTITADNVLFENFYFNEATVATGVANINIAAANVTVRKCHMDMGANDRDGITVTAAGEKPVIEDCSVIVTADGPDTFITFEGVIDMPIVRRNHIIASDGTDEFDDECLDFGALAITNPIVMDNVFDGADVAVDTLSDLGGVVGDCFAGNRYAGSATDRDTVTTTSTTLAAGGIAAASFAAGALQAMQDEAEDALEGESLDHLAAVTTAAADMTVEVVDGSVLSRILTVAANTSDYTAATDSLEAIANAAGTNLTTLTDNHLLLMERAVQKTDGAVLNGDDNLFTISGGPIMVVEFVGVVTTVIGANVATCTIQEAVTDPAGDVALSTAVNIENDAAGTTYTFTAAGPSVLTPTTVGALTNVAANRWLCPIGTIQALCSAANTGNIEWYMVYKPLSPDSRVVAAA